MRYQDVTCALADRRYGLFKVKLDTISYKCVSVPLVEWSHTLPQAQMWSVFYFTQRTKITHTHPDTPTTSNTQLHSSTVSVVSVSRYHLFWVSNMLQCGEDSALPVFDQRGAELPCTEPKSLLAILISHPFILLIKYSQLFTFMTLSVQYN